MRCGDISDRPSRPLHAAPSAGARHFQRRAGCAERVRIEADSAQKPLPFPSIPFLFFPRNELYQWVARGAGPEKNSLPLVPARSLSDTAGNARRSRDRGVNQRALRVQTPRVRRDDGRGSRRAPCRMAVAERLRRNRAHGVLLHGSVSTYIEHSCGSVKILLVFLQRETRDGPAAIREKARAAPISGRR